MPRIRSVKPEFFGSEPVGNCSPTSRLLFVALWCMADDEGRCVDNPKIIRAFAFPLDDDITGAVVDQMLHELYAARLIVRYEVEGRKYLAVRNFREHQHPKKRIASKLPSPEVGTECPTSSPLVPHQFPTSGARSGSGSGSGRVEGEGVTESATPARKRTGPKGSGEKAFPYFAADDRARVLAAFKRIGEFRSGRIINAIGACYRPETDPEHIPHDYVSLGVEDYCGLITKGRSAPFAGPEDCAKKLIPLARNCWQFEQRSDPVGRHDANMVVIHGMLPRSVAA